VRMSKSLGNHIPILAEPSDMYGKVMSLPDSAMPIFFKLVTRYTPPQVRAVEEALASGARHPRDVKMELAREIVSIFYDEMAAAEAEEHFKRVFQEHEMPEEMPEFCLAGPTNILNLIVQARLAPSKSEARRLVTQHGVKLDGRMVDNIEATVEVTTPQVLQVGKRKFVRLVKS
jgi:tyrosyl-tRNA synthetase